MFYLFFFLYKKNGGNGCLWITGQVRIYESCQVLTRTLSCALAMFALVRKIEQLLAGREMARLFACHPQSLHILPSQVLCTGRASKMPAGDAQQGNRQAGIRILDSEARGKNLARTRCCLIRPEERPCSGYACVTSQGRFPHPQRSPWLRRQHRTHGNRLGRWDVHGPDVAFHAGPYSWDTPYPPIEGPCDDCHAQDYPGASEPCCRAAAAFSAPAAAIYAYVGSCRSRMSC